MFTINCTIVHNMYVFSWRYFTMQINSPCIAKSPTIPLFLCCIYLWVCRPLQIYECTPPNQSARSATWEFGIYEFRKHSKIANKLWYHFTRSKLKYTRSNIQSTMYRQPIEGRETNALLSFMSAPRTLSVELQHQAQYRPPITTPPQPYSTSIPIEWPETFWGHSIGTCM